jgi:formylglycine-generating enzyme required for sulfatase activity
MSARFVRWMALLGAVMACALAARPLLAAEPALLVAPFDAAAARSAQTAWARQLGKTNPEETNSIGMKLVLIPPGEFQMGSHDGGVDETPVHRVRITRPFYLSVYEVTQTEYQRVMSSNPSWFSSTGGGKDDVLGLDTSRYPVEEVSWKDAEEFCRHLSQRDGVMYRLPTEAEWEYACRAGTTTAFHFGNVLNGQEANVDGNYPYGTSSKGPHLKRTTSVGSYSANNFGLFDMHGNVWEWCADWYDESYYGNSPVEDPAGAASGSHRVLRGGSWLSYARRCRSAFRDVNTPDNRYDYLGFRVAFSPPVK